jgi:hypothetical protein
LFNALCSGASLKSSHTTLSACFSTKHLLANNGPAMHKTDIFDAWARVMGIDAQRNFPQLVESVAQWLGVPSSLAVDQQPSSSEFALGASSKSGRVAYLLETSNSKQNAENPVIDVLFLAHHDVVCLMHFAQAHR